jgi:chromosome segregation ATPase
MGIVMSEEWLERIEKKIDTQARSQQRLEDRVEIHGRKLDEHGRILEAHGRKLDEHGRILEEHGKILEEHGRKLDEHGRKLDEHGRLLESHGLELHRLGVLGEKTRDDVRVLAESVVALGERMDRGFKEVLDRVDERIAPLEIVVRDIAAKVNDHAPTRSKPPRRRRPH